MGLIKNIIIKQKAKAFNRRQLREKIFRQEKAKFEKAKAKEREKVIRDKIKAKFQRKLEKPSVFSKPKDGEKKKDPFEYMFGGGFF